jgi:hypothetical protein
MKLGKLIVVHSPGQHQLLLVTDVGVLRSLTRQPPSQAWE